MKEFQERIREFNDERGWSKPSSIKDLLLNMNEEIGEFWNIIKWVGPEMQQKLIRENMEETENFVGDMLYLVLKVSYLCGVDPEKALEEVMEEYGKRFPADRARGSHANIRAGGIDLR